jgi:hypothetical protein
MSIVWTAPRYFQSDSYLNSPSLKIEAPRLENCKNSVVNSVEA